MPPRCAPYQCVRAGWETAGRGGPGEAAWGFPGSLLQSSASEDGPAESCGGGAQTQKDQSTETQSQFRSERFLSNIVSLSIEHNIHELNITFWTNCAGFNGSSVSWFISKMSTITHIEEKVTVCCQSNFGQLDVTAGRSHLIESRTDNTPSASQVDAPPDWLLPTNKWNPSRYLTFSIYFSFFFLPVPSHHERGALGFYQLASMGKQPGTIPDAR